MKAGFWFFLFLALLMLIHYSLSASPPEEWRDFAIGRFYLFQKDEKGAIRAFKKVLEKRQINPRVLLEIGRLLLSVGKQEEGEEFLRRAVERYPSADTYYFLGQSLYLDGKLGEAEEVLEKALELDPSNPYVLNDLGYIWVEQDKRLDEAVEMLERALRKVRSPEILDSLGWAYVKEGQVKRGLVLLKQAVERRPYNWELRYHLAVAYEKLGKKAFSQVELRKAEILFNKQR